MAVNNVYKATYEFSAPDAAGPMNFNIHYRTVIDNTSQSAQAEAGEIAQEAVNTVLLDYIPLVPTPVTFIGVTVVGLTDPTALGQVASGANGGGGVNPVSYRNAPVAKLLSGQRGRSLNGRIFLMASDESQQTGGVMLATYITSLQAAVEAMRVLVGVTSTNVYQATIYSEVLTGTGPIVDNLVENIVVNPKFGTQRSRQDVA